MAYYKAVRLDRTSHYDKETKWCVGTTVRVAYPDPPEVGVCGVGIHCSPTLLNAARWQTGPSCYCEVEPITIIASDGTKARCDGVRVLRWLGKDEQDELAAFKLHEANHAFNPLLHRTRKVNRQALLEQWASARASVRASVGAVGNSVRASARAVGGSVWYSVQASVWASVRESVWAVGASGWASARASVGDSVWAYIGGLFPRISKWAYAGSLGPDPWRPLLTLWYGGYVPSFDGTTWRLHAGPNADAVHEWTPKGGE